MHQEMFFIVPVIAETMETILWRFFSYNWTARIRKPLRNSGMKAPMNKVSHSWDYAKSLINHKFWNPNDELNPEQEEDIKGKIVIVTGSNTGIGKEAALQFAKRGARVIMACRDVQKAQKAMESIHQKIPSAQIEILNLDLADLQSVRNFVKEFTGKYDKLDILVNNAGFGNCKGVLLKTKSGMEYHVGVNHVGPFLLTRLLIDSLKKAASSKIISVASSNMLLSRLNLNDLMMEQGIRTGDGGIEPYNVSKLANAMCIRRLASLLGPESGIKVFNLCPGLVRTEIFRNDPGFKSIFILKVGLKIVGIPPEMGCETIIFCATSKKLAADKGCGKGEMYRFTKFWKKGNDFLDPHDEDAVKLYAVTEKLAGL